MRAVPFARARPPLRVCLLLALLPWLGACNPFSKAPSMMDEYVERVGRVLEVDAQLSPVPDAARMPRRRDRMLALPDLDMGILDFLSLYGCELQYVVGEKNSVLGRVMQPLNRLRYELRFIRSAQDCLPSVDDKDLRTTVKDAIAAKQKSLPLAIWNATWGSPDIESLFSLAQGTYPVRKPGDTGGNPVSDLAREAAQMDAAVQRLLAGKLDVSLEFAGDVHQRWQAESRAGQLIRSAVLLTARLDDATGLIQRRLDGRPLCLNQKPNPQATVVRNVFFNIYIGKVQPYLADVRRARDALMVPMAALAEAQSAVMPATFRPWYERYLALTGETSVWQGLDRAMADHTRAWQALLGQCGMRPGA
ncbi:DUF3080 domain-containing protein [Marinobacter sp. C2H3]|uniref:DUF3080 domain-containing protein n=1 Tax=Marinobacter sp. C2H3 TaxID=3119003 RepID=UPI00300E7830